MNNTEPITIRGNLPTQHMKPAVVKNLWARRKAAKEMRSAWALLALSVAPHRPMIKRFKLVYRYAAPSQVYMRTFGIHLQDKDKPYSPRDYDNLRAAAKPALDGLQDGGLIAGDSRTNVVADPVEYCGRAAVGAGWLELVIMPVDEVTA